MTGKSFRFYKPNILQQHNGTVLITDPKGELLRDCGYALTQAGYKIKVLNLDDLSKSNHFNVFDYIPFRKKINNSEQKYNLTNDELLSKEWEPDDVAIDLVVDTILQNTQGDSGKSSGDPFWDNSSKMLLKSVFFYLLCNAKREDQNLGVLFDMLLKASDKGDNSLTNMFDEWQFGQVVLGAKNRPIKQNMPFWETMSDEEKADYNIDPNGVIRRKQWVNKFGVDMVAEPFNPGVKSWAALQAGAGSEKTMGSIYISTTARLQAISSPQLAELLSSDDMELYKIGMENDLNEDGKEIINSGGQIAYFVCTAPSKPNFNFIAALLFTIGFQQLDSNAKKHADGRCPRPVNFYLDEIANVGRIPRLIENMALET